MLGSIGLLAVTSYASFRHSDRHNESSTQLALERVQKLPEAMLKTVTEFSLFGEVGSLIDGQNAIYCALLTIEMTETEESLDHEWFHMPIFIATNPIPRSIWPGKPEGLGKILPETQGEHRVSWGPSIIGHCFYDGGWIMVILYGLGTGWSIRWIDGLMFQDPDNPWQIAFLASVSGHIIGFSRGDCGIFGINILGPIVLMFAALFAMRYTLGLRHRISPIGLAAAPPGGQLQ